MLFALWHFSFAKSLIQCSSWEAAAYTAVSFTVPDNWKAGRIWVRGWLILVTRGLEKANRADVTAISPPIPVQTLVWTVDAMEGSSVIPTQELWATPMSTPLKLMITFLGCSTCDGCRVDFARRWKPRFLWWFGPQPRCLTMFILTISWCR